MKKQFDVKGMTCAACQANVEKCVLKLEGVQTAEVSLLSNTMNVEFDEEQIQPEQIVFAVDSIGYTASLKGKQNKDLYQNEWDERKNRIESEQKDSKKRVFFSVLLLIVLMLVAMGPMIGLPILAGIPNALLSSITQMILSASILLIQKHFFVRGFKALVKKSPNMDSLVAIGSLASFLYGLYSVYRMAYGFGYADLVLVKEAMHALYFESAAMIVTLVSVGKYLESRSKSKTTDALSKLVNLAPKMATILKDGQEILVQAVDIQPHDIVVIKPGEKIPVDGVILSGTGYLDQSAITGESIPVEKKKGDDVITATVNQNGSFQFEATKVGNDTTLAKIIQLVDEAGNSKAPIARIADKVSGFFVPVVIFIAIMTGIVWLSLGADMQFAFSNAISVLVISCPCALGLATPVAIMVGTGKAAEQGILIKSAESLENLHKMDTVVLDKTGTITNGKPIVQEIETYSNLNEVEFLKLAASLEQGSQHPLGEAIVFEAKKRGLLWSSVDSFLSISGRGLQATRNGSMYFAGNFSLMQENEIEVDSKIVKRLDELSELGQTPLLFAEDGKIIGLISLADSVRNTSIKAIETLKQMGMHVVMLTGDNEKTANAIGKQVGINDCISGVLPTDKERVIRELQAQGKKVIMVGDGINDAPALVRADVGVAIGAGTDIALDSADVILLKDQLLDVVQAIALSKKVIQNIRMNLFWAFFYNILGIPIAAGVFYPMFGWHLTPMIGAATMSMSSLCVVTNALRLRFIKPIFEQQEIEFERKEEKMMKKELIIEGMMCPHCVNHVDKALRAVPGVCDVQVNLDMKNAIVSMQDEIADAILSSAVTEQGYTVQSVKTIL